MNPTNNLAKVTDFFAAYTEHNVEKMLALCAPDATFRYVPLAEQGVGSIHDQAAGIWRMYINAFPDFRVDVVNAMQTTENSIVCETLNSGTQAADVAGIKNQGKRMQVPHLFVFEFGEGDLIAKITAFWDNDTVFKQLDHTESHD